MESEPDPIEYIGAFATYEEAVMALPQEEREELGRGLQLAATRDEHNWPTDYPLDEQLRRQDEFLRWWMHDKFMINEFETFIDVYRIIDNS